MAVYTHNVLLSATRRQECLDRLAGVNRQENWNDARDVPYWQAQLEAGTFNELTDVMRTSNEFVRLVIDSVGTTIHCELKYCYIGDGDGYYYGSAIYKNAQGEFVTIRCGLSDYYKGDLLGSAVDAPQALIDEYNEYVAERQRLHEIERYNTYTAYDGQVGKYAIVMRSSRKHKGKSGKITWMGDSGYGESYRIETDSESFFVPTHYCDIVPDWSDAW
jgi:hypothetical protein